MFPFWYPAPYWYNYYYYFYKYPTYYRNEEYDENEEHDYYSDDAANESIYHENRQMQTPAGTGYTPGAPTQYPLGNLGHYGYTGGTQPGGPGQTLQTAQSPDEIFRTLEQSDPEIMKTMAAYSIPYETARRMIVRVIEASLRYCR
jgi:hypothetical protein